MHSIGLLVDVHHKGTPTRTRRRFSLGDGRRVKILSTSPSAESSQGPSTENMTLPPSTSAPLFKDINSLSPSPKMSKHFNSPKRKGSAELDSGGASPNKTDKRRNDKDKKASFDLNGLFEAVEHQDMDQVKLILDSNGLDVNSTNEENLTPLDVAVLTNNIPMAKTLLSYGAKENPTFLREELRADLLESLVSDAERRVVDLTAAVLSGGGHSGVSSVQQQKENGRQLSHWEFRHRLLKRMKAGYDHARAPDAPASVLLGVASSSSLLVRFDEPVNHNGAVVTRYKVEWSCFENFTPLAGETITDDIQHPEYEINDLIKGNMYYVRVAAGNMKGYGPYTVANPPYAVPSSWRDMEGVKPRSEGKLQLMEDLFTQVKQARPANAPELKDTNGSGNDSPVQRKRKSIKNLFASAPKFQKSLRRGVYLACLLYNEDRVLVTSEEQIPIVEVDENFTSPSIHADFHWMMKIACTWDDVKSLRQDMERSSSGTAHFRSKLLQAATVLQNALGVHDLGQLYHQHLKDDSGCILLTTVNYVRDPKHVALISGKWIPISKLQRRLSLSGSETSDASEMLLNSLSEMILYHQVSMIPLPRGLYLGYLKLRCTMDLILRVQVHQKTPNVLPYTKIRECPNVSKEEWEWVRKLSDQDENFEPSEAQLEFQKDLIKSSQRLLDVLGVPADQVSGHRMYDIEVIELSPEVSFLLILPPTEDVCSVPGQVDDFSEKTEFTALTVPVFEMIHMCSYQPEFISRYSRLSSIIETDLYLAQQEQRGAFSNEELNLAKERVDLLDSLQQNLEKAWKAMRWIMDLISFARDKNVRGGIPLSVLKTLPSPKQSPQQAGTDLENENNNSESVCDAMTCESNQIRVGKDNQKIAKFYDPNEELLSGPTHSHSDRFHTRELNPLTAATSQRTSKSGILRVYAAYETGLAKGTSVKLHVTPKTTAREVINLVVQQLNKAVCMKGRSGPIYPEEQLNEFCLVAVIGARERVLRDDYQPLQLQNPWTKGRLYVRMKSNLLAAIQQGQATAV
ncbi:ankyrin repeat and fibronectin type-III domain-containing protein 1-like isoform X2 [Liolophura sinensis]|uniref:ankyrin repeat and fibronectin type-III domain-containing protein 1-like isoform X2 n=1 Tax=Liolophura sinensis TaxID=3198878 RepID=UPI003158E335